MYRLLNVTALSKQNFKILTQSNYWPDHQLFCYNCHQQQQQQQQQLLQTKRFFSSFCYGTSWIPSNKYQTTKYVPGFSSIIFSTNRPQSTTLSVDVIDSTKTKKRKRFKAKQFAELIQVNDGGSLKETKASVQKLKSKRLTDFIESSNLIGLGDVFSTTIATSDSIKTTTTKGRKKKKKIGKQQEQQSETPTANMTINDIRYLVDDNILEPPILSIKSEFNKKPLTNMQLLQIMESYKVFRETHCDLDYPDYVSAEHSVGIIGGSKASDQAFMETGMEPNFEEEPFYDNLDLETLLPSQPRIIKKSEKKSIKQRELVSNRKANINTTTNPIKSKNHTSHEHELIAKHKSLEQNLLVYLNICVSTGMTNRGFATMQNFRARCKNFANPIKIENIKLYNTLMAGYAEKGNFHRIKEILAIINEDKIIYTPQTYATVFECLGRMEPDTETLILLQEYEQRALSQNITLNNIMDKSKFINDQKEMVMSAIRQIHPTFTANYTAPPVYYDNELLIGLNEHIHEYNADHQQQQQQPQQNIPENIEQPAIGSEIQIPKNGFTKEQLMNFANEQLKIETDAIIKIKSIEIFPEITPYVENLRKKLVEHESMWRSQILAAFNRDLSTMRSQMHSKGCRSISLFPYLKALEPEQYIDILLQELRLLAEGSETFSLTVSQLQKQIGEKVQLRFHIKQKTNNGVAKKTNEIYENYCDQICSRKSSDNPRQIWQRLVHQRQNDGPSMNIIDRVWPVSILHGVGRFLFLILMRDVKFDVNAVRTVRKSQNLLPAFYTLFRNEGKMVKEEVKPHPALAKLFRGSQQQTLMLDSNSVPMLCPPQPWSTPTNGGYLLARSQLIRLPDYAYQQWDRIFTGNKSNMYPALDSLNQLSSIAWRVNTNVLDVILNVFNAGGSKELDVPQPPSALPPLSTHDDLTNHIYTPFTKSQTLLPIAEDEEEEALINKKDLYQKFRQKLLHRRKQSEMYSLWCDTLYRLSLANHYRDRVFWLPHNMDFRGRVYPIPPHLNHLGSDLARSLLVFNQAQPLGPDGFNWLKLHCINLTGFKKKCSVNERLDYVNDHMDDILDSADNPLNGRKWWATSDEPWQTLSACMEIANVYRSSDPEKYMSHYPIHQDGSCNGLQHYAALGRDTAGAVSVNLAPSKVPQDVYSDVALLVEETRRNDAQQNNLQVAKVLEGFIQRKVIKQTVMTTVYGVTRFGARLQIARQLKDIDKFPKEWVWPAASYLTAKTFESLQEMFTSTREIQDWFTHCARLIAATGGHNVEWITPLGMPVVQPYSRFDKRNFAKSMTPTNIISDMYTKPNVMKQKNAFPPNFIHSLDSSHMMLTSLHCDKKGLTFMSVHDCYWTHARSVADMNRICREQFVALHSQPILENLSDYFVRQYSYTETDFSNDGSVIDTTKRKLNRTLQKLPNKGDFDLENVLDSIYFFS